MPAFGSQLFNTTEQDLCKTNTSDNHIIHLQPIMALDPTLRQTNTVHIFPCNLSKIIWILSSQLPIYTQVLEAVSFFHVFLQKPHMHFSSHPYVPHATHLILGLITLITFTRWFKYDRDYLCVNKSQFVPVIFEPPCTFSMNHEAPHCAIFSSLLSLSPS